MIKVAILDALHRGLMKLKRSSTIIIEELFQRVERGPAYRLRQPVGCTVYDESVVLCAPFKLSNQGNCSLKEPTERLEPFV